MPKLTQMQFYNVGTKKAFTAKKNDIDVVEIKNSNFPKGFVPALRTFKNGKPFYKFISPSKYVAMVKKFGEGNM